MAEQEDIVTKYKRLSERKTTLEAQKMKIEAELSARKRALKEAIDQCKADGFNPDTLADDIKKMKEVLYVKLNVFEADLNTAEEQMKPIIRELS